MCLKYLSIYITVRIIVMDKLWKWMVKKGYAEFVNHNPYGDEKDYYLISGNVTIQRKGNISPQMFNGYMIEYIRDHKYWVEAKTHP